MHSFLTDLRASIRLSWRSPRLTAVVIFTLALGIGAATTIFSFIDTVVSSRLPGAGETRQLVSIWRTLAGKDFDTFSYPNYQSLKEETTSFAGIAAYHSSPLSISRSGSSRRIQGALVSGNYFEVLGVRAFLGRMLSADDDKIGSAPVVMLSYSLWRQLGENSNLIGSQLLVNASPVTVVGVAAQEFGGVSLSEQDELWLPLSLQPLAMPGFARNINDIFLNRQSSWLSLFGRLKSGVSQERAQAELNLVMQHLRTAYPQENSRVGAVLSSVVGVDPETRADWLRFCGFLMGAVGLVLLLSCANLGNFVLARMASRRHQVAICLALGATRARILRQVLMQTVFLSAMGGLVGYLLRFVLNKGVMSFLPPSRQMSVYAYSEFHVFLFVLSLSLITGVLLGLLPAWTMSETGVGTMLKTSAQQAGSRRNWAQQWLVVLQVAISLVLLLGTALLAQTLRQYARVELGFDISDMVLLNVEPEMQSYKEQQAYRFQQELLDRLNAIPGIRSVTLARVSPLSNAGWGANVQVPGKEPDSFQYNVVSPNYFHFMGIPLRAGRDFTPQDNGNVGRVVILNETAAKKLWLQQDAIGKQLFVAGESNPREVIGVVRDSKYRRIVERPRPFMYLPMWQPHPFPTAPVTIQIRSSVALMELTHGVEQAVHSIDPDLPVFDSRSINEQISATIWQQRLAAAMISFFAGVAIVLGTLGVFSTLAYSVGERTQEIAVRMALGARRRNVLYLILWQGLKMSGIGIILGVLAALGLAPALSTYVYGIAPRDPVTLMAVALLMLATALTASYFPAYAASRLEPMTALRRE